MEVDITGAGQFNLVCVVGLVLFLVMVSWRGNREREGKAGGNFFTIAIVKKLFAPVKYNKLEYFYFLKNCNQFYSFYFQVIYNLNALRYSGHRRHYRIRSKAKKKRKKARITASAQRESVQAKKS